MAEVVVVAVVAAMEEMGWASVLGKDRDRGKVQGMGRRAGRGGVDMMVVGVRGMWYCRFVGSTSRVREWLEA